MISSRTRRMLRQGRVGPAIGNGMISYGHNRKNSCKRGKNSRRYRIQVVLPGKPNRKIGEIISEYRLRLRIWKKSVKPLKAIRHDQWS